MPVWGWITGGAAVGGGIAASNAWQNSGGPDALDDLADDISDRVKDWEHEKMHQRCDEPPPPWLDDPCERAKWKLRKALECRQQREGYNNRWFGGNYDSGHFDRMNQLDNEIRKLEKKVERLCKKDKCEFP